jgi:DNA mismatch repair protein MutS
LKIQQRRHPILELLGEELGEPFVPNDIQLDDQERQILLITGPNMAGKSTVMRQVALIQILSQMGCFVPAQQATLSLCDRVFARVGAADDLARGRSTFMVEMAETSHILKNATPFSLVLLDEIGRGTSTYDGLAIAWAVTEYLHQQVGARTLFATHYHELTSLESTLPKLKNVHVAVFEKDKDITILRLLKEGPATRSYGIHVGKLAGLPVEVLNRATSLLEKFESGKTPLKAGSEVQNQWVMFPGPTTTVPSPVSEPPWFMKELEGVIIDELTPLDALNILSKLKKQAVEKEHVKTQKNRKVH